MIVNYSNSQRAGVILYLTALIFGAYDKTSWVNFFQWLRSRGLDGVKLVVGDKCFGMLEAVGEVFPEAQYQQCTVHVYRNIFAVTPRSKAKLVAKMLKAIHAQESKKVAHERPKLW